MLYERFVVLARHKTLHKRNIFLQFVGVIAIWSLLLLAPIIHLHFYLYQLIYFSIYDIPKIRFKDYWVLDRWDLHKLTIWQKASCVYCGYGNALTARTKAVTNQTEVYSCAIKHSTHVLGEEHEKKFFPYDKFR